MIKNNLINPQTIDFVITWVDGNDKKWQKEKSQYEKIDNIENGLEFWNKSDSRYRDWELLKYWFRGVEKFAPWVNKIHFVTWGHIPDWLDVSNPKLNIVKHTDFIPHKYLPTFSSHTIELNLHRIEGLSEQFVYFNDDMFLLSSVSSELFFKNGVPCDAAIINPIRMIQNGIRAEINDMYIINHFFNKNDVIKKNFCKFINIKYGKYLVRTLLMLPYPYFSGFYIQHLPTSFLKSTFESVWENVEKELNQTCINKFRKSTDVNQWLMQYWQYVTGKFIPRKIHIGKMFEGMTDIDVICNNIENQNYPLICCNDSVDIENFDYCKERLMKSFEKILSEKSSFEV